jgi:hypothetical protein
MSDAQDVDFLVIMAARHPVLAGYGTTPGNPHIQRHLYINCGSFRRWVNDLVRDRDP